jgi:hypothetical protein
MNPDDIQRAIRATALELLQGQQTFGELVAKLTALASTIAPRPDREAAEAERKARRAAMLAEYYRLQPKLGRSTATAVARKFARDRRDRAEVENLATVLRRWVAEEKQTASVSAAGNQVEHGYGKTNRYPPPDGPRRD